MRHFSIPANIVWHASDILCQVLMLRGAGNIYQHSVYYLYTLINFDEEDAEFSLVIYLFTAILKACPYFIDN